MMEMMNEDVMLCNVDYIGKWPARSYPFNTLWLQL